MPRKKKDLVTTGIEILPRKMGRPSKYTPELADEICSRIALGNSLRTICQADDMPNITTVIAWRREKPEFSKQYERAREDRGDWLAEDALEIIDQTPETEPVKDKDGNIIEMRLHSAYVTWQKNRVDARRWFASKLAPKGFGDKVQTEVSGPDGEAIKVSAVPLDVASLSPEARAALRAALLEAKSKG